MLRLIGRLGLVAVCGLLLAPALGAVNKVSATVTIDNTAGGVALPASLITVGGVQQSRCYGRVQTAEIRFWTDGSAPTTTVGIPVEALEFVSIEGFEAMTQWRAIRTTGVSATLSIECWR